MSYLEINNPWGIEDKKLGASLTGSTTLVKSTNDVLWWNSVIIDFWMHQWSENAALLNKEIPKNLINADNLVITHAHMDHIWRVPQLVKAWFKWNIIMTPITKDLALVMWEDYIKLVKNQIDGLEEWNKKKWQNFRDLLKIVKTYDKLKENNLGNNEKNKLKKSLNNLYDNWNDIESIYIKAKKILSDNGILWENDVEKILNSNIPELLYDVKDVYETIKLIKTLEVWEEINLDSRIVITKKDSEVIDRIPKIIEDWYNKKIYVLPHLKQYIINKWYSDYDNTVSYNSDNKIKREEYNKAYKFVYNYNKAKNKSKIILPKWKELKQYLEECNYILKNSDIWIFKRDLEEWFTYKSILDSAEKFNSIKNENKDSIKLKINNLSQEIDSENNLEIDSYKIEDLIKFYNKNKIIIKNIDFYNLISNFISENNIEWINNFIILSEKNKEFNKYIKKWKNNSIKNQLWKFYNNYLFYLNNKKIIDLILNEWSNGLINEKDWKINKNIISKEYLEINKNIINKKYEFIKSLNKKLEVLRKQDKLIDEYEEYKKSENFYKEKVNILDEYNCDDRSDIDDTIKERFWNKKLKYTKKQISIAKNKLRIVLEKNNEKIVESLKLKFYDAGHIEWSIIASLSYITKEIKSNVNFIIDYWKNRFNWHKEIKKSFKNLLFSWDLWKDTNPNLSWKPDIPEYKYDYTQLESTYSDREHPNKVEEFNKLIEILNNSKWKVLIAAFSLQRTQEIETELLNNKYENLDNIEKIKKIHKRKSNLSKEYNKLLSLNKLDKQQNDRKEELFISISSLENEIKNSSKNFFSWFLLQDSPLAWKVKDIFIKYFPEKYKILDPLYQKSLFWKEQVRVLQAGEYKKIHNVDRKLSRDIIISSGWMMQWWAIINHIKNMVSDSNSTIILSWYVAEWTLARELLDIEKKLIDAKNLDKKIIIDWEEYEVKCKIVSIWWYSSHMWQWDLVNFWWNKLKYSKNATLSLTHWDENRTILKWLIEKVNSQIDIIVPKLWDSFKINL